MGTKDKKKESKPSSSNNTKEKQQEPEKKGKGHKQKGAGTVVVSKGEVTVGGVVMKEWQRTPVQLVQEYCQRQKRPKPIFQNDRAPAGSFCVRVILPDSKNKEKDLVFSSADSFPDSVLAKNCTCLLALHHLQPTLPLHQKLPEPYSSMWLKLTGSEATPKASTEVTQFVCTICNRSFEKEMGLKIHMKKDHSGKKAVTSSDVSPVSPVSPVPSVSEDVSVKQSITSSSSVKPSSANPSSTKSTPSSSTKPTPPSTAKSNPSSSTKPTPSTSVKPPRIIADHRNNTEYQDMTLESKSHFTSKYDRMMAEEKKRIHMSQSEKRKEIERQLNHPPTVFLSESNQTFIQTLLQEQEEKLRQVCDSREDEKSIRKELEELGFSSSVIQKALAVPSNYTTFDCIDWCCIHLKDSDLPPSFRASGKQLEVQKIRSTVTFADYLDDFGFNEKSWREDLSQGKPSEVILLSLLRRVFPSFQEQSRSTEQQANLEEEISALQSIYPDELKIHSFDALQLLDYSGPDYRLVFVIAPSFSYPQAKPIVFFITKSIAKNQRVSFMQFLYKKYEVGHTSLLYEIIVDCEELIKEFHRQQLSSSSSSSSKQSYISYTPSSKQYHKKRVIDKKNLEGSPSSTIQQQRQQLPITKYQSEILSMIHSNQVSLISGGTGCGKSTQVPQFLIDDFKQSKEDDLNIIVCEPRRISCLGLYSRVLAEQGIKASSSCPIGYQVRGDSVMNPQTVLTYCTTGVLLRQLQSDTPDSITHIIVDEIHERSILSDFLLLLLKRIIKKNPSIKIILMSATMDSTLFCEYFQTVATISVEGRLFPIEEHYLDDIVFDLHYQPHMFTRIDYSTIQQSSDMEDMLTQWCEKYQDYSLIPVIARSIFESQQPWKGGVILVFLSGSSEIKYVKDIIEDTFEENDYPVEIIQCHGSLSTQEQKRVFEDDCSQYRIVLATNIAETSLTIPHCKYVIDVGKEKRVCYNSASHISEMKEVWISKASAEQRKGRAGRVQDGIVYRLYTRTKYHQFESYTPPEMLRSPLDGICLQVLRMNLGHPVQVLSSCITPPLEKNVQSALDTLQEIQAIHYHHQSVQLTSLGNHLADLPVDCRLGKILLYACLLHCVESVITITAFLSQRSVFRAPFEKRDEMMQHKRLFSYRWSDHLSLLRLYNDFCNAKNRREFCYEHFINYESMLTVESLRRQFIQELQNIHFLPRNYNAQSVYNTNNNEENIIKAALTAGMYANVIRIEKTRIKYHRTIEGGSFESTPEAKEYRLIVHRVIEGCDHRDDLSRVYIHPSSLNFSEREYPYPYMIYTTIMNTTKLFVHDTTVIPPYCLLLFAGEISIQHLEGTLSIDNWLYFTSPARIGVLIQRLRKYVDLLLQEKLDYPETSISNDPVIEKICSLVISNGLFCVCFIRIFFIL